MTKINKIGLAILIFFFCTGFDRMTKDFAQNKLSALPPVSMLNDSVRIQYSENTGGMLNLGADLPSQVRIILFVVFVGIMLSGITVYAIKTHDLNSAQLIGLFLFVSGGAGNFIDRLINNGAGIDFLNIGIDSLRTGIFNFADVFIMIGASVFILASRKKETSAIKK
ncbi:MAG: signal peptidase II [Candidatus Promineifilaceae bacterium]